MAARVADPGYVEQARAGREAVASEVRALMGRFQVSQTALGQAIGVGQSGLSRRLRGDIPFDVDDLYAIAAYFGVPINSVVPSDGAGAA
jgi:transcriptional regulator with XRE-family HTH domain